MAEPTLPPYLGRTLLEDESDAEEAHQRERVGRGSLDSNVEKGEERGERRAIPDDNIGHLDLDISPTQTFYYRSQDSSFSFGRVGGGFLSLNASRVWTYIGTS